MIGFRVLGVLSVVFVLAASALVGCDATPRPAPTSDIPRTECDRAAQGVVDAVAGVVAGYGTDIAAGGPASPPTASPLPTPRASGDDPIGAAVARAKTVRDRYGCDDTGFRSAVGLGLAGITAHGALADAVLRRIRANLLGLARTEAGEWRLSATDDLRDVVARAAQGTVVVLPAATFTLDTTLVVLAGVTIRGAGRDATTVTSTATGAAMLVATSDRVRVEALSFDLSGAPSASGLVAGPSASLALDGVRIAGATTGADGLGGAGLYMSAQGAEGSGRGTTLEVTDSVFAHNAWAGVAVAGGHRVSIEKTSFVANGEIGIVFLDASSGSVGHSTFSGNGVGLAATGSATPTWLSSTITGGTVGAQLDGDSAPTIAGLDIGGATTAAVVFGGRSGGSISGTTCHDVGAGIVVSDSAAPTVSGGGCPLARARS